MVRSSFTVAILALSLASGLLSGCKSKPTAPRCEETACESGLTCVQTDQGALCLGACPCTDGLTCVDGFCRDRCSDDGDCANGLRCETTRGVCRSDAPPAGSVGATCEWTDDCSIANADCYEEYDGFPGGTCSADCHLSTGCPDGATCLVTSISGDGRCFASCTADSDCREGYNCASRDGVNTCLPTCTTWNSCYSNERCDSASGRCVPARTVGGGYAGTTATINVGSVTASQSGGPLMDFDIPENLVSLLLVGLAEDPTAEVALSQLNGPTEQIFDIRSPYSWPLKIYPYGVGGAAILLPNSPTLGLQPGSYQASFYSNKNTSVSLSMVTKSATGPLTGGRIDLNIWLASRYLNANTAAKDESLQAVMKEVRRRWAAAGLELGQVSYYDVPDAESYRSITEDDVATLCRFSSGAAEDRLNWYFVDSIDSAARYGTTLGIASGIPGAPIRGTGISGVVISLIDWPNSPKTLASTMVHETGHWLGLFHPSERDGKNFDPLDDTPRCTIDRDRNGNGVVESYECFFQDGNNVMFWQSDTYGQPQDHWSDGQSFVMLRHPAVH